MLQREISDYQNFTVQSSGEYLEKLLKQNIVNFDFLSKIKKGVDMIEYRPCIVIEKIYPDMGMQGIIEQKEHKALFHGWIKKIFPRYETNNSGMGDWCFPKFIGNDEFIVGIVEYEDGTIHEHFAREIRFMDGKSEKISKNKKDDWNKLTEDIYSYPEQYEKVLFKTSDGRIFYGFSDMECKWNIELEDGYFHEINDVTEWRIL